MDIPLRHAQIVWDHHPEDADVPPVKVVDGTRRDDPNYMASWGVCNSEFADADDGEKLLMLFLQFHQFVTIEEMDPGAVHSAFLVIPEYREALLNHTPELVPARYHPDE